LTDVARTFVGESRQYLRGAYLTAIERSIAPLTDVQVWWRPNEASNSIGNLILHLSGNVRQWIVGGVGRQPDQRDRQREFDERDVIPKEQLLARLRTVLDEADAVLAGLTEADLTEPREIQGHDTTVLKAIFHVVEHFSTHTGQILWMAKSRLGAPR